MNKSINGSFFIASLFLFSSLCKAQLSLPKVFGDSMVLQRGIAIPVWGTAGAGSQITAQLGTVHATAKAGKDGKWMLRFPKFTAGGPYTLKIAEQGKPGTAIELKGILIGDVWVASGQSNMELQVQQAGDAQHEIAKANFPKIRFLVVEHDKQLSPQSDLMAAKWKVCDTASVKELSAVAYYFARKLHGDHHVPVGIIQSTWGGTPVEAWTSREMLLTSPITKAKTLSNDTLSFDREDFVTDSLSWARIWNIVYNPQNNADNILSAAEYNDADWTKIEMPNVLKDFGIGNYEGMVWLRKKVLLPESFAGKELTINLGHPEMNYSLYFNGQEICKNIWNSNPTHSFTIPARLVKSGENTIAVRVAMLWGGGGLNPPAEDVYITDGASTISLAGKWLYKKDLEPAFPKILNYQYYPTVLFNAMINPLIPYGIKGFIWYQGESNAWDAYNYRTLFPMLIKDWRQRWQQGDCPFLFVQLANYMKTKPLPAESEWAELREAQTMTLSLPNTGMACIIDIGEASDIHPKNKQEVGRRLALIANKLVYKQNVPASGPVYNGFQKAGNRIRINFTNTGSGLSTKDGKEVTGFAIAGNDHKFYWAKAGIEGDHVIVYADRVPEPEAVRYAWADNPECNLVNSEKLPAVPFRTDNWKGITQQQEQEVAQELYVGANYHPHDDKNMEKIKSDIQLMKEAGFKVVRMGHLAWDSYEPAEGKFDFGWFDTVMNMMGEAGIKVILDIAIRPAPIWLHHKYPSIDIVDAGGDVQYPNHRYMEDVGDPNYQKYALRYTDTLTKRYGKHPALLAFGIDNESGDGKISYSETARKRFITWLKNKYLTTGQLNEAWATQRWSRRINEFEEIGFPVSGTINGAPERMLDFRRFVSDEINQLLLHVIEKVNTNAPNVLVNTNAWYYSPLKYFDYSQIAYSGKMTREGCGFYPGNSLTTDYGVMNALFGISRIQFESTNPFWCSEFTTMTAVPNSIRKSAYATLLYGNQMVCGWTWQSMHAGEEQYLEGMLDWDGVPNRKYEEYRKIATEFKKIEKFFPYKDQAEVGLAFSFPGQIASSYFPEQHDAQLQTCWDLFYQRNMDTRIVEISRSALNYKLLLVPGVAVMDEPTAVKIRNFVKNGGTVVMTSNSAIVDESGQVFSTTRPGRLSDVFGIRVGSYEETASLNEISRRSLKGKELELAYNGKVIHTEASRFDIVEPKGAKVLGSITSLDKDYPVITVNKYGNGKAIYLGLPADGKILDPLLDELINELGIKKGPEAPSGIMARQIDNNHFLYLNVSGAPKEIPVKGNSRSLLYEKQYKGNFTIAPYEPEFIELN